MSTKCKWINGVQTFHTTPMMVACGTIEENVTLTLAAETALFSTTLPAGLFDSTNMAFKLTIAGTISSAASTDDGDITFRLRMGTTDILETIVTSTYPNEDDKAFILEYWGRIHTVGSSGKVVATGRLAMEATGMSDVKKGTAVTGATVDLTAVTSINVTGHWDKTATDIDCVMHYGVLELFNQ